MKKVYANLILVLITIIWGGGFLATNGALEHVAPMYILVIRFMGSAIFLILLCAKKLMLLDRKVIYHGILAGIFLFFAFLFQTYGLQNSTPSKNAFLTATNVVFVPYLLWLIMKKKPSRKEWIASFICVFGIALLTLKKDAFFISSGDILTILCAIFFALHLIVLGRYSAETDTLCMTALQMLTAGILSIAGAVVSRTPWTPINVNAFGELFYLIFLSTLLAYILQTYAQKYTTANSASLILSMEALFASLFSFLLLHETMSIPMLIGALLILLSVIYIEYDPNEKLKERNK